MMDELTLKIEKPKTFCGIVGVYGAEGASNYVYYGLNALQHRGQEAAGIVTRERTSDKTFFNVHKRTGLVSDVFKDDKVLHEVLRGDAAIGHNRYSTTGAAESGKNVQPIVVNYRKGNLAIAHNGNLTNSHRLRDELTDAGTLFQTTTDTEIILHLIARSQKETVIEQVYEALQQIRGAFSLVILSDNQLIVARDPYGFRPLALGKLGDAFIAASETCALDVIGAEYVRDIEPGEMLVMDDEAVERGEVRSMFLPEIPKQSRHCIFEFIYFSRPDSKIFGESVDKVRRKIGKGLAEESPVQNDEDEKLVVISVPDSSNTATLGYVSQSLKMGIKAKFEIGLIRSHYIGRTFIQPSQDIRDLKVKMKFNTVKGVLKGRKVVIVDDSIVRGTTSKQLVKLIREAEPSEVHFRVSSPPIMHPCYYGMDFPSEKELFANQFDGNIEKMTEELNVDSLSYLSLEKLLDSVPVDERRNYCTACFSGEYPTEVESNSKEEFEANINEARE
ncbi:MAG: amidophosphoribosyltransferase [Bacteroidetes bacterium]|nr:amidophosphoribosyltransferase [Bacteroidota bacterium]MCL5034439.1 amidophosphoribosyltransferase [Bacteroidota bacterium]